MPNNTSTIHLSLKRLFPYLFNVNLGIFLICTHIFLNLGAFQQLVDFVVPMKIPFIIDSVTAIYALYLVLSRKFMPFAGKLSRNFTMLFIFICFYSTISSINVNIRNNGLKLFLIYYSNFVIASCCVKNICQLSIVLDAFLLAILHTCYHGIRQGGLIWSSKWLGDQNEISILAVCAIPYCSMLLLLYKNILRKIIYTTIMISCISLVIIANSRGGALALFVCGLFCWLFFEKKFRTIVIIFLTVTAILIFAPRKWFLEIETIQQGTEESTAFDRTYGWKLAELMFSDFPISGVGIFNYPEFYVPYNLKYRIKANRHPSRNPYIKRVAHSTPIEWIAETGIIGSVLFSLFLLSLYTNWRQLDLHCKKFSTESARYLKANNNATAVAIISFWAGALFVSILIWPFLWTLILFSEMGKNVSSQFPASNSSEIKAPCKDNKNS